MKRIYLLDKWPWLGSGFSLALGGVLLWNGRFEGAFMWTWAVIWLVKTWRDDSERGYMSAIYDKALQRHEAKTAITEVRDDTDTI
jgi:hypothetical protein